MINIACSTCLESFTSGCDISTTPCGHVFHTGCITRWLNVNTDCSQCRKGCELSQLIKLFFSESQSAIEESIKINMLKQKSIELEEKSQRCDFELNLMKTEVTQSNQKCYKLEQEKLLMKLDWSKTEWSLKKSMKEANKRIKDYEMLEGEPLYSNAKQYHRILKRRQARAKFVVRSTRPCAEVQIQRGLPTIQMPSVSSNGKAAPAARALDAPSIPPGIHPLNAIIFEKNLKIEGLEKERDFYFGKLRDIEVVAQEQEGAIEVIPGEFGQKILEMLYATEEGFAVPEEDGDDLP